MIKHFIGVGLGVLSRMGKWRIEAGLAIMMDFFLFFKCLSYEISVGLPSKLKFRGGSTCCYSQAGSLYEYLHTHTVRII